MGVSLPLGFSPSNTPANVNLDVITAEIAALNGAVVNAPINVKNAPFNAKGDGVTDDTVAINKATTAAAVNGGAVLIPSGTYVISGDIVLGSKTTLVMDAVTINSNTGRIRVPSGTSNVVIDGRSTSQIIFLNGNPALSLDRAIRVESPTVSLLPISAGITVGTSTFTCTNAGDAAALVANQWVLVGEFDSDWQRAEWKQVLSVAGSVVTVTTPFRRTMNTYTMGFYNQLTCCQNITIRGMTIVTTGVVNDNYGIDAESCRNLLMEDCRFDIAKGLAFQTYMQDHATVRRNLIDRQVGRRSSFSCCIDSVLDNNDFCAKGAAPTEGAVSVETGSAFGSVTNNRMVGVSLSGVIAHEWCDYMLYEHNTITSAGGSIGLYILGGDGNVSHENQFFNVLDGVRFDSDTSLSPTRTCIGNASVADLIRTATRGVYVRSGSTNARVYLTNADTSVTTPVLDSGTGTSLFNPPSGGGATALQSGTTIPQQFQLTGAPTSVTQFLLGSSSAFGGVGTLFSSGDTFAAYNASSALGSDLWTQSNSGAASAIMVMGAASTFFYTAPAGTAAAIFATFWTLVGQIDITGFVNMKTGGGLKVASTQVVTNRRTGWAAQTTGTSRADMGATPSAATVYQTLAALIDDLTTHGLIGP